MITPVCSHLYWTYQKVSRIICDVATPKKRQLRKGELGKFGLPRYNRERLLATLNDPATWPPGSSDNLSRVFEIIAELNEIGARTPSASATSVLDLTEDMPEKRIKIDGREIIMLSVPTRMDEFERELNKRMERYSSHPYFRFRKGRLLVGYAQVGNRSESLTISSRLVPMMIDALGAGDLQKLARCQLPQCRRWFLKRVGGQRFCPAPAKCRQKAFEDTPEFRAERAKYMQDWRWLHANKNVVTKNFKSKRKRRKR